MWWRMVELSGRLHREEDGAAMVEYAIVTAVIAAASIVATRAMGTQVTRIFNNIVSTLGSV